MKAKSCRMSLAYAVGILVAALGGATSAAADIIDFSAYTGPAYFAEAGPAQTLSISTSIGTMTVAGGVILSDATYCPACETSVYGTAYFGDDLSNTITLTFPTSINNFFLYLLNGQTYPDTFTAADNAGHSTTVTIAPNTSSGTALISFPASGNIVTLTTTDSDWDFLVNKFGFDQPTPTSTVPEPATLTLLGTGLFGLLAASKRKRASSPRVSRS